MSLADLYGRTEEKIILQKHIDEKNPLIVVSGLRRIGKTSLVMSVLNSLDHSIYLNVWDIGATSKITKEQVMELFEHGIQKFFDSHKKITNQLISFLQSVAGISVNASVAGTGGGGSIQFHPPDKSEVTLVSLFSGLNDWAIENEQIITIAIDEVQEFSKSIDIDLAKFFSSFYNYENIVLILTGSQVGLLYNFINKEDSQSPFYGKDIVPLKIEPLSEDESKGFLLKAFEEEGSIKIQRIIPYDQIIDEASKELGGIIGWLVNFGLECVRNGRITEESIINTQETGAVQVRDEFNKFIYGTSDSEKFNQIMRALTNLTSFDFDCFIKEQKYEKFLQKLEYNGFLKSDSKKRYFFSDPLLAHSFLKEYHGSEESENKMPKKKKPTPSKKKPKKKTVVKKKPTPSKKKPKKKKRTK